MKPLENILYDEIAEFKQIAYQFINGETTRGDFKAISGGMGVYAHRDGEHFMIRLRVAGGILSKEQLRDIYELATENQLDKIHLTTRQAVQLHHLGVEGICSVMQKALAKKLYSRGSGGNFPRNVALSPLSGVEPNEVFDVTQYALAVSQYFLDKIYTYKLPRKFKVAFSNGGSDLVNCMATDMGFCAFKKQGEDYFKLYVGGGLGRNSAKGILLKELVKPEEVLYYVEAMTQLFIHEGDYENKGKARLRYIVKKMGEEAFIQCFYHYLALQKRHKDLELKIDRLNTQKQVIDEIKQTHPRLFSQKQYGLYSVYIHPIGGQFYLQDLKRILNVLEPIEKAEIRLSMSQGFYIINLNEQEASELLQITEHIGGNIAFEQSMACIGVPVCQIGVLNSQKLLNDTISYLREQGTPTHALPKIRICGCSNSCAAHEMGTIGLVGKMKRIDGQSQSVFEVYTQDSIPQIEATKLGQYRGDILENQVPKFFNQLALMINKNEMDILENILAKFKV